MKKAAVLYGVSVGPGDPELITLKAVKRIEQAEVIAAPRVKGADSRVLEVVKKVCDLSDKSVVLLDFPMSEDNIRCRINYEKVADTLEKYLDEGKNVAFLTLGDISIYSTCSYVLQICKNDGYPVEEIPGVSAFLTAAARLGCPLVQGEESLLITNSRDPHFEDLMRQGTNIVVMKSRTTLEKLQSLLSDRQEYEIMAVSNCGMEQERIYTDTNGKSNKFTEDARRESLAEDQDCVQETVRKEIADRESWEYFTTALCCRKKQ